MSLSYHAHLAAMTGQDTQVETHPRLYFKDGDVVLSAELPPAGRVRRIQLFRIHSFLLRHHSAVFSNMFADAISDEVDVYQGRPLIALPNDNAEDFAQLLLFIYNPLELHFGRGDPYTPLSIAGTLRLANKYLLDTLRERLIAQVVDDWPRSLFDWDRQEAEFTSIKESIGGNKDRPARYTNFVDCVPEPVTAILFAQEFGCNEILPAAFYQLSRMSINQDWDTQDHKDLDRLARWSLLEKDNLLRYLRGCQALDDYCDGMTSVSVVGAALSHGCRPWWSWDDIDAEEADEDARSYPCFEFVNRLFQIAWRRRGPRDPLRSLDICLRFEGLTFLTKAQPKGLCQQCEDVLIRWTREERKLLWDRLPEFFDLRHA